MDPVIIHPHPRFRTKVKTVALLIYLVMFFWWSVPLVFLGGNELGGIALGALLVVVSHGALIWLTFWFADLYVNNMQYEIHPDEVVVRIGVITQSVKHVPFRTVTNLKVSRDPFDRIWKLGSLAIQTAGASGTSSTPEEKLEGLVDVQAAYDHVARELRRFRGGLSPAQSDDEEAAPRPANGAGVLGEILDELRAIRARIEAE